MGGEGDALKLVHSLTASNTPGHVVAHIKALKCGGADDPSNTQRQTIECSEFLFSPSWPIRVDSPAPIG